jgi:hypothetical protein
MGRVNNSYRTTWLLRDVPGEIMNLGFTIRKYPIMIENLREDSEDSYVDNSDDSSDYSFY